MIGIYIKNKHLTDIAAEKVIYLTLKVANLWTDGRTFLIIQRVASLLKNTYQFGNICCCFSKKVTKTDFFGYNKYNE